MSTGQFMGDPHISIIIPTFNSSKVIRQCLDSIVNQTCQHYEVLIIDGSSGDETIEIVKTYAERFPFVRWISEKDGGIYDAMNKGILMARTDWIYFLGDDDVLYDDHVLTDLVNTSFNGGDIIYGNVLFKKSQKIYDGKFSRIKLIDRNICHQAIIFHKRVFNKKGLYNLKYKYLADYEHNIRWFNDKSIKKRYFDRIVAVYNERGSSFVIRDVDFINDKSILYAKSFPRWIRFLSKVRKTKPIRVLMNKFKNMK